MSAASSSSPTRRDFDPILSSSCRSSHRSFRFRCRRALHVPQELLALGSTAPTTAPGERAALAARAAYASACASGSATSRPPEVCASREDQEIVLGTPAPDLASARAGSARCRGEPPGATPSATSRRACESSGIARHGELRRRSGRLHHLVRVPEQAEARHVRRGVDVEAVHGLDRRAVERAHDLRRPPRARRPRVLRGGARRPRAAESMRPARTVIPMPSGLVSTSASPGRAPVLRVTLASSTTPVTDRP